MTKTLVLAYPGSGKTYVSENYARCVDFEHQDFIYIYDDSIAHLPLDQRKGNTDLRRPNPGWSQNYFAAAIAGLDAGDILIAPFVEPVFAAFDSEEFKALAGDVRIILVMPELANFDELEARYRARGNGENFIKRRREELPMIRELFDKATYEKTLLTRGQFLDSALAKHGIKLSTIVDKR